MIQNLTPDIIKNQQNYKQKKMALKIIYFIITAQICLGSPSKNSFNIIKVNKCCEKFEILVDTRCENAKETNSSKIKK